MNSDTASQATNPASLTAAMRATAPMLETLGVEVLELGERVRIRMPNEERIRNHVGGPHAGAIFTLGETTAATLMMVRLGHLLDRAVPLAVSGEIRWSKLAQCAVIAEATMSVDPAELEREFLSGGRPEWSTDITFTREDDGAPCAAMSVVLTLVRPRADPPR